MEIEIENKDRGIVFKITFFFEARGWLLLWLSAAIASLPLPSGLTLTPLLPVDSTSVYLKNICLFDVMKRSRQTAA